jgi:hypothetical protein
MNVEIGAGNTQILFWEYLFRISIFCLCSVHVEEGLVRMVKGDIETGEPFRSSL